MEIAFHIFMTLIGACMGSFLCCQTRRLHYNTTHKTKLKSPHSLCLNCKKNLKWYDNIPILSWLVLEGKCRFCHRKIGIAEFLSEVGTAIAFLLLSFSVSYNTQNLLEWSIFVTTVIFATVLIFLAIYDGIYGELPTFFLLLSILIAIILLSLKTWFCLTKAPFTPDLIINPALSVLILGGLYLILYLISKGRWVGDGDWILATAIAMVLAHPFLAVFALFLSNFSACLIAIPFLKKGTKAKIHFGPFLVIAFIIIESFSTFFIKLML